MKEKLVYINGLRAIATFAVVLLHVSANYWYGNIGSVGWVISTSYLSAVRCAVPIFVMISGALFLRKEYTLNIKRLYTHNIFRLLVFLVFWHVVYQIYHIFVGGQGLNTESFVNVVKTLLRGETQVHLWFVYMIIGIYIICPVFKVFIENAKKNG